jgi:hypothetical protein
MSGENADRRDQAASLDEWRVDVEEPVKPSAPAPDAASQWSRAESGRQRERVSAELASWRRELDERLRRLEERLPRPDSE